MPAKVTFDGPSKSILLEPAVTTLDVEVDLYSEWKRWAILENNLGYLGAFRTFGGDQTISGQFAPKYFFLTGGWRVVVATGVDLLVGTNLYTDELDSPFVVSNNSTVSLTNSDAAVVDAGISQSLDYAGVIHVSMTNGVAGTTYPTGTMIQPVNNIVDAKALANLYGIRELHIRGTLIIDEDLESFIVFGGNLNDVVILTNVSCDQTTFRQCLLQGSYTGVIAGDNCGLLDGLTGMNGYFQNCGLVGRLNFAPDAQCTLNACHSQVPGMNSPSLYLNTGVQLSVRKYSGGLALYDMGAGSTGTIEFLVGNCRLLTGNVGGTLVVRGLATLTNNTTGTEVITEGMIVPNQLPTVADLTVVNEGVKKASKSIPHNTDLP